MFRSPRCLERLAAVETQPVAVDRQRQADRTDGRTDRQCSPSRTHIRPVQSQPTLPRICSRLCLSWKLFPDSNVTTPEHTVKASQHHLACTLAFRFDYSVLVITGKHNWVEIHCQKVSPHLQWQLSAAHIHFKIELFFCDFGFAVASVL